MAVGSRGDGRKKEEVLAFLSLLLLRWEKALAVWEKFPAAAFVMFFSAELEGDPKELPLPVPVRDQYYWGASGDGKIECLPSLV